MPQRACTVGRGDGENPYDSAYRNSNSIWLLTEYNHIIYVPFYHTLKPYYDMQKQKQKAHIVLTQHKVEYQRLTREH